MKRTPEELRAVWNSNRGEMLPCAGLDIKNRKALAESALQREPDLTKWANAIKRAAASPFCTGKLGEPAFVANFDWLIKLETLQLIEEGQFDSRGIPIPQDQPQHHPEPYWSEEKPVWHIKEDEFFHAQVEGRLFSMFEKQTKKRIVFDKRHVNQDCVLVPKFTEEQRRFAEDEVRRLRAEGKLPKSFGEFNKKFARG